MINLIVAHDKNKNIGKDNKIPWQISEDMKFFKDITSGHVCVMGKNTWISLPDKFRPLPNRKNIIVSKTYKNDPKSLMQSIQNLDNFDDVWTVSSPEDALEISKLNWPNKEIFIIGGFNLYKHFMDCDLVDKMFITEVDLSVEGDTKFPDFDKSKWDSQQIRCLKKISVYKYTKKYV